VIKLLRVIGAESKVRHGRLHSTVTFLRRENGKVTFDRSASVLLDLTVILKFNY
jgi:hypothetical protein